MKMEELTLIHSYSRAEALADGVLVDVTEMAKEAGFVNHTVITQALHATTSEIPGWATGESYEGRLWDVLWVAVVTARGEAKKPTRSDRFDFRVVMSTGGSKETLDLRAVCGPDDEGLPCMTIGYPEDF